MPRLEVGSEFAGHRLEEVAGRGGMGIVFRATDLSLDRVVALKVIAPELAGVQRFARRFVRESKVAASTRNAHLLPVYRAGVEEGHMFVTMEFIEGRDLAEWIGRDGRLDPALAVDIVAQVAEALDAAHANDLVHRDVKPANVLIEDRPPGPHAYLTDFGLSKALASEETALTATGTVVGTLDYMAPEQLRGQPVDGRIDVYALGCVLFEALTGRVPYPEETPAAKMLAHADHPVPRLPEAAPHLNPALGPVVERAMAKDPADRFASAGDLGRAARAAIATAEQVESARPAGEWELGRPE